MKKLHAGKYELPLGSRTLVMGIVNVTPDSFFDGGKFNACDQAVRQAKQMVEDGVDMIDVGGESTRPGASEVSSEEEMSRVIPIIEKIANEVDVPLSIDTYKADVANEAIRAGAHIINDVWGGKKDPLMAEVAAENACPIILMHNRLQMDYTSFMDDVLRDIQESLQIVEYAGVSREKIVLDPGIGFSKTVEQNLMVLRNVEQLVDLGFPVLLGTSNKSFIGNILGLGVTKRWEGTLATLAFGIMKGCQIVRVHDVASTVRFCKMMDAMCNLEGEG